MPRPRRFNLYPLNRNADLDPKLFKNPTAEYRGAPFWSWNSRLDLPQLFRQIEQTRQMGFGGFHIHSRTGLENEYLGDEYIRAVVECTKRAKNLGMLSWLYDEDRWPSGFAGGIVTRDPQYRIRRLLWTTRDVPDEVLLAQYHVELTDGLLTRYERINPRRKARTFKGAVLWNAFLGSPSPDPWFNNQTYVDTLSTSAIQKFIEVTHERFYNSIGKEFGKAIPAIFTDEPQFKKKMFFERPEQTELSMPWTDDFADTYRATYGHDILDHLPELFWNLPDDKPSRARYCYHDHTAQRFAQAFGDQIGEWCDKHGIALTGHMLGESRLFSQTRGVGEAMRGLRSFQIPGIDLLCDAFEFTTAKQAQSLVHQFNRPAMLSELYGVTNWDFDFVGHKAQGDWQAALGVTIRVPHLQWQSMAGESKRDYPAPIGYQSPWWKEYPLIENHFARLNTVMTRGKALVRVGIIHPIESYWLCFGALPQNQREMEQREQEFRDLPEWLLYGGIDFDFIAESLGTGSMKYDAILVPNLRTIRATTLNLLEKLLKAGGTVIFAGNVPKLVDAAPSQRAIRFAKRCAAVPMSRRAILEALESFREIDVRHADGSPADSILHQLRVDGDRRHLFLCNTDRRGARSVRIAVRGKWDVTTMSTMTGETHPAPASLERDRTVIPHDFPAAGHLLIALSRAKQSACRLQPACVLRNSENMQAKACTPIVVARIQDSVRVTLSEPNVGLLDQARWRVDDGEWKPIEEALRIGNIVRKMLNLPLQGAKIAQPWTDTSPAPILAKLQLRFAIQSDIELASASLALEDAAKILVELDGRKVRREVAGWWVDEAIQTISLPKLAPGEHELMLTIPFTRKTSVEWCYLLGDFGVTIAGRRARIVAPPRTLAFGDWTRQGLPFYAGNVTYHCTIEGDSSELLLEVPKFKSPLLSVNLDGKLRGKIAFPPFQLALGKLKGRHALDITAYGNRVNAFGPVHHTNTGLKWVGPDAWRSTGANWAYEYQLKPTGILTAPILKR